MFFLEMWRKAWASSQVATGTSGTHLYCLKEVESLLKL